MTQADFFLSSTESHLLKPVRRCSVVMRLHGRRRDDYLLVRIDPPIIGQAFGLGGEDIERVLLATRHQGVSLFPTREWPVAVHVARLLKPPSNSGAISDEDIVSLAWGELYPSAEAAEAKGQ